MAAEDSWSTLANGTVRLLDAVRRLGVYRPTEDIEKTHLAMLGKIADAVVEAAGESGATFSILPIHGKACIAFNYH